VGWVPSVDSLYLVQLLRWGFDNTTGTELESGEEQLPDRLERLSPKRQMQVLSEGQEPLLESNELDALAPQTAVQRILEALRLLPPQE
jgi:hypothetical protein